MRDLNGLYRDAAPLHQLDCESRGFAWIDCNDRDNSVISWLRKAEDEKDFLVVIGNFTPMVRTFYRLGVPSAGWYREVMNTDSTFYGGSDVGLDGGVMAEPIPWHGHPYSLALRLPPLAVLYLRSDRG